MAQSELALGSSAFPISSFPGFPGACTRNFKGTITAGLLYSFADLLSDLIQADTLLIQHTGGGQVRIGGGPPGTPNLFERFEPPVSALAAAVNPVSGSILSGTAGYVAGQNGWTPSFANDVVNVAMMQVITSTIAGGVSTQSALVIGDGNQTNIRAKHSITPSIPAATAYLGHAEFYLPTLPVIVEPSFTVNVGPTNASLIPSLAELSIVIFDDGSLVIYDNAGTTVVAAGTVSLAAWHKLDWVVTAANAVTIYLDGVSIYIGVVPAGLARAFFSVECNTGATRPANTITVYFDNLYIMQNTVSASGLLIPAGTGQELHAGVKRIDLNRVFIAVDAGAADATVEILGIGGG